MKYGFELSKRSVPEWRAYNLDYNEIKTIIKHATSPNAPPDAPRAVFDALKEQYDAIGLFVKSKSGEIERRVRDCEKIVNSIAEKDQHQQRQAAAVAAASPTLTAVDSGTATPPSSAPGSASSNSSSSPSGTPAYARGKSRNALVFLLRQEVVQLTRDVQRLARFIGVQRTGFRKLLKKYKKWSQSSAVSDLFLPILEAPSSFTNQDFTSIFLELSLLYNVLRQARSSQISKVSATSFLPSQGNEALCKFDCEMVTAISSSLTFWVHPDNVVEIKVMLLKNLGLVSDDSVTSSLSKSSSSASIKDSAKSKPARPSDDESDTDSDGEAASGVAATTAAAAAAALPTLADTSSNNNNTDNDHSYAIYLDNPKRFNSIQTHSEPGQIRWVRSSTASPALPESSRVLCSPVGGLRHFCIASLKEQQLDHILHSQFDAVSKDAKEAAAEAASSPPATPSSALANSLAANNLSRLALSWVEKRKAVPISKASFNRTRFRYLKPKDPKDAAAPGAAAAVTEQPKPHILPISASPITDVSLSSLSSSLGRPNSVPAAADGSVPSLASGGDIWASLDSDIRLFRPQNNDDPAAQPFSTSPTSPITDAGGFSVDTLSSSQTAVSQDALSFPYSVLEIRYKGMEKPAWLADLEASHLVYPVSGFSLYAHSVASFYQDSLSHLPSWSKIVQDGIDIRRTPQKNTNTAAATAAAAAAAAAAAQQTTPASTAGILLNSNEREPLLRNNSNPNYTDGFTDKLGQASSQQTATNTADSADPNQPVVRYWNEFDDPEDDHDNGVFVIIPDGEDDRGGVFSEQNVARLLNLSDYFLKKAHRARRKIARFFGFDRARGPDDSDSDSYEEYEDDDFYYYENRGGLPTIYEEEEDDDDDDDDEEEDDDDYDGEEAYYNQRFKNSGTAAGRSYGYGAGANGAGIGPYYYSRGEPVGRHGGAGGHGSGGHGGAHRHGIEDDYYSFPVGYNSYTASEQRDYILTVLYTLCFSLSTLMMMILFGVIVGENMDGISAGTFGAIVCGLTMSLGICFLAMCLFLMRSQFPSGLHQTLVYMTFFSSICFGIGGVVWLIA